MGWIGYLSRLQALTKRRLTPLAKGVLAFRRMLAGILLGTLLVGAAAHAAPAQPKIIIKKTMDGRCLTKVHKDYWKTKIYVAKPNLGACIASGGRPV